MKSTSIKVYINCALCKGHLGHKGQMSEHGLTRAIANIVIVETYPNDSITWLKVRFEQFTVY